MARALIVGCGCHGRELGVRLRERGWEVRGTSRGAEGTAAIEAAGLEAAVADPNRPGTVLELCGDVTVVVWLLGSVRGEAELVAAIHGPRLERLLEKLVDTPVRGFAYEAAGPTDEPHLRRGREIVERAGETWRIPVVALDEEREADGWAGRCAAAISGLVGA
ncbi:MAG: hypothetical protein ACRDK5_11760 [Solirubrobacterales bacterium]